MSSRKYWVSGILGWVAGMLCILNDHPRWAVPMAFLMIFAAVWLFRRIGSLGRRLRILSSSKRRWLSPSSSARRK